MNAYKLKPAKNTDQYRKSFIKLLVGHILIEVKKATKITFSSEWIEFAGPVGQSLPSLNVSKGVSLIFLLETLTAQNST